MLCHAPRRRRHACLRRAMPERARACERDVYTRCRCTLSICAALMLIHVASVRVSAPLIPMLIFISFIDIFDAFLIFDATPFHFDAFHAALFCLPAAIIAAFAMLFFCPPCAAQHGAQCALISPLMLSSFLPRDLPIVLRCHALLRCAIIRAVADISLIDILHIFIAASMRGAFTPHRCAPPLRTCPSDDRRDIRKRAAG